MVGLYRRRVGQVGGQVKAIASPPRSLRRGWTRLRPSAVRRQPSESLPRADQDSVPNPADAARAEWAAVGDAQPRAPARARETNPWPYSRTNPASGLRSRTSRRVRAARGPPSVRADEKHRRLLHRAP